MMNAEQHQVAADLCIKLTGSVSFIPGLGDGSLPRSSPGSSTGVSDRFGSGGWATTPAEPGHASDSVGPDVLPFHRLHYTVDRWRSPVIQYDVDWLPATESDQCIAVPP